MFITIIERISKGDYKPLKATAYRKIHSKIDKKNQLLRLAGASSRFAAYHILLSIQNIIREKKEHEQYQKCEQVQKQNLTS